MHPDLENFLEFALSSIPPTSPDIGRVVVEPDYEAEPSESDVPALRDELLACLREQYPDKTVLASHQGFELKTPANYKLLAKYIRSITLHADKIEGAWVEVAPPGNWI